jgi:diguanylate cyclase (GGDEF)-like protein
MNRDLTLFYADLDGMKAINDNHGHAEGDRALREIADILRKTFRDSDIIARVGGDEFAVLALETTHQKPEQIIQRLEVGIAKHNRTPGQRYALSLSVGAVYMDTESTISIEEIMARADAEMYRVKQARRAGRAV